MLGLARPRKIVEMTIGKLSYEFCRILPSNDLSTLPDDTAPFLRSHQDGSRFHSQKYGPPLQSRSSGLVWDALRAMHSEIIGLGEKTSQYQQGNFLVAITVEGLLHKHSTGHLAPLPNGVECLERHRRFSNAVLSR